MWDMNKQEIYNSIKSLAGSQGFYRRLLNKIDANPDILDYLESLNFTDIVDLMIFNEQ